MNNILILCEGITDQIFIADCIEIFFDIPTKRQKNSEGKLNISFGVNSSIMEVGGCERIRNAFILDAMRDNTALGGINLVVFDADFSPDGTGDKIGTGNKGIENARKSLRALQVDRSVVFDFFLWPNNHDDGEIEHLLKQLIPKDKEPVFDCITNHHECLQSTMVNNIVVADIKTQLRYYLYTLSMDRASKASDRNYKDQDYWNLKHSGEINVFREFLNIHLSKG